MILISFLSVTIIMLLLVYYSLVEKKSTEIHEVSRGKVRIALAKFCIALNIGRSSV